MLAVAAGSAGSILGAGAADEAREPVTVSLRLDPTILDMERLKASRMGYMPARIPLIAERPAGITKEPAYQATPRYGCLRIGNGSRPSWRSTSGTTTKAGSTSTPTRTATSPMTILEPGRRAASSAA